MGKSYVCVCAGVCVWGAAKGGVSSASTEMGAKLKATAPAALAVVATAASLSSHCPSHCHIAFLMILYLLLLLVLLLVVVLLLLLLLLLLAPHAELCFRPPLAVSKRSKSQPTFAIRDGSGKWSSQRCSFSRWYSDGSFI